MTFLNVIPRHCPGEDAKCELQRLRGETNDECPVVHRVEQETHEEKEEDSSKNVQAVSAHTPDQQQEEEERERQEERFCPVRSDSLVVQEIVIHDYHLVL